MIEFKQASNNCMTGTIGEYFSIPSNEANLRAKGRIRNSGREAGRPGSLQNEFDTCALHAD